MWGREIRLEWGRRWRCVGKGFLKLRKFGRRLQQGRKVQDVSLHFALAMTVKSEDLHFTQGLFRGPMLDAHAVGGDKNPGAIFAVMAMHENGLLWLVTKDAQKLNDLPGSGRGKAADRNMYEAQAEHLRLLTLRRENSGIFEAQIDDGGDAQFL